MPVSKKRKKDGKPVQRSHPALAGGETVHPDDRPEHGADFRGGKPKNPFVTQQQQSKRGAQRGR
jgi:hypothetical protein